MLRDDKREQNALDDVFVTNLLPRLPMPDLEAFRLVSRHANSLFKRAENYGGEDENDLTGALFKSKFLQHYGNFLNLDSYDNHRIAHTDYIDIFNSLKVTHCEEKDRELIMQLLIRVAEGDDLLVKKLIEQHNLPSSVWTKTKLGGDHDDESPYLRKLLFTAAQSKNQKMLDLVFNHIHLNNSELTIHQRVLFAITLNQFDYVKQHIHEIDVNADTQYPHIADITSLLATAVKFNRHQITQFLLEHNANPNTREVMNNAGHFGTKETISLLLDVDRFTTEILQEGLIAAARSGNITSADMFIKAGADINYRLDKRPFNMTPLIDAARNGNLKMVQWLLANGADANLPNITGEYNALDGALHDEHEELARFLIAHGITRVDEDSWGSTLYDALVLDSDKLADSLNELAAEKGLSFDDYLNVENPRFCSSFWLNLFAKNIWSPPQKELFQTVQYIPQLIKKYIESGLNINYRLANQGTILFAAAQEGKYGLVRFLLDKGADQTICFRTNKKAMRAFVEEKSPEIQNRMIAFLDEFKSEAVKISPLQIAEMMGHFRVAGLLKDYQQKAAPTQSL